MDLAKETPICFAVRLQGVMLGRHEVELAAVRHAVEILIAQVTELIGQLQDLHSAQSALQQPRNFPEPRINNPPCYSGQPTECRAFLTQCEVIFSLQPTTYAEDRSKVAFVFSLLTGRARDWGAAVWESEVSCCEQFSAFKEEMIFDRSVYGHEASRQLVTLRQGRRSAADHAIEFRTLAATCEWNEQALTARFLEALSGEIKEEILSRDLPTRLDQLVELAIRLNKLFELRRRARYTMPELRAAPPIVSSPTVVSPGPEPLQLGGLRISAAERLCMYCGAQGHLGGRGEFYGWELGTRSRHSCSGVKWPTYYLCPGWSHPFHDSLCHRSGESHRFRQSPRDNFLFYFVFPLSPIVLGHPWLTQNNPQFNWVEGTFLSWGLSCHVKCLVSAMPAVSSVSVFQEEPGDLSGVPEEYHDMRAVFSRSRATSLPPHRPYDCSIDLVPGSTPPRGRLYSLSAPEREALERYLADSLAAGTIVPSTSPTRAGFFFMKKKDGSLRPCIDYRGLNEMTIKNWYPLPLMSSAFEILQGAKIFTKLDLHNVYHLVRIKEGDEWKTAFNTPLGHFEYRVIPFGLVNAPAVFQALVNDVLRDMLNIFVFVYLDDIIIFSPSFQEHVQHVRGVLQCLLENRLFVKAEKCVFHASSVSFLGSVVSADGISMDPAKVRTVMDWPVPDPRTALQRFLGFANFYRRFIRNFSQVATPLTALTSTKSRFTWSSGGFRSS